ncbi:hypothetical protein V6N12_050643 [Hibiscus sabdariffa]|uniref:Zinc finger, CCHC-type n=1 Tax=Hibiscus sabdariffa TaxID=183260 RepID=A0ABR2GDL9_9ROSI
MANNSISLRSLLEKEKLNGINFLDWFRNLRIVLKQERKEYVIEEPVPDEPAANAPRADKDKFKKHMDDMVDVGCLMLATMNSELQKQHENMVAYEMIQNLKEIYEGQACQERYETSKALFQCKMIEGTPVGAHVIKMMGYIQMLEKLGMLRTAEGDMRKGGSKSILVVREVKRKEKKVANVGERKEHVIEEPVPDEPAANAPRADKDKFKKYMDDMVDVGCLMLATMDSELQKQHENMVAYEMIQNLKEIYEAQARQERYETSKALFQCKMTEGTPVGAHVIKMMGYVQTLEKLGFPLKNELATDLILQSLPGSFKPFVLNFNMNEISKTLPQLLGRLRTAESDMKKDGSKSILLVREAKGKGSGKTKAKEKMY